MKKLNWPDDYINKVICGDCLEVMKGIPDGVIDVVVTDPPYGVGWEYGEHYDDTVESLTKIAKPSVVECRRIAKLVVISSGIANAWLYPQPTWVLCWNYAPTTQQQCRWGFNQWSPMLVYGPDPYLKHGRGGVPDVIDDTRINFEKRSHRHPCPKPISFMLKLIKRVSIFESDIILDPFAGSGTTLLAAKRLGKKYIGIELNQDFCNIAEDSLKQDYMFIPSEPYRTVKEKMNQDYLFDPKG